MSGPVSASYAATMRLKLDPDDTRLFGVVSHTIGEGGGAVTAVDFVETRAMQTVDITVNARGEEHVRELAEAIDAIEGASVYKVSDRTFLMHLGGKLEVKSRVPLATRDDLSMAYTPGVARICRAIAENPEDARRLTIKGNSVAIVTDGSAVLGLGNIGPLAGMPVMEGKAVLFKRFADIDAWPICLSTQDPDEIIAAVVAIAPGFGGINLEDIAAPGAFAIEEALRDRLDIPVFHDDQHGTAIVVSAALRNAMRLTGRRLQDLTITMAGAGAAGTAIAKLLLSEGVGDIRLSDRSGVIHTSRTDLNDASRELAEHTNSQGVTGSLRDSLRGADVFIGVSAPNVIEPSDIATMNDDPIVFALANPDPEVDPIAAGDFAAVIATGRSDLPNQINNVLAFPGVFRGALDAKAKTITDGMKIAAAVAIADVIEDEDLHRRYIIPSVFNAKVAPRVAAAVAESAKDEGVCA